MQFLQKGFFLILGVIRCLKELRKLHSLFFFWSYHLKGYLSIRIRIRNFKTKSSDPDPEKIASDPQNTDVRILTL